MVKSNQSERVWVFKTGGGGYTVESPRKTTKYGKQTGRFDDDCD